MDVDRFAARVDDVFVGPWTDGAPVDGRFAEVARTVTGYCTPAELAVLHAAVGALPASEAYLEVGTFKGRSICGALVDGTDRSVVAVENFQEFGMSGADARAELYDNLARFSGAAPRFRLVEGDCFDVLARPPADLDPVGVYFYDGAHTWVAHYLALGVAEPLLADEALVLVDDASWPVVRRATLAFVGRRAGWTVVRSFDAATDHDPRWANGLMLLRYRRPDGATREMAADVRVLRAVQRLLLGPFFGLAWRVVPRSRALTAIGRRFFGRRSHRVSTDARPRS